MIYRRYATLIMLIISSILLILSVVLAWAVFVEKKPLASFETGEIVITALVNGDDTLETFNLTSLCYIDFQNDVILNRTNSINSAATVISIRINNGEESTPITNTISLLEDFSKNGLLFLIIYNGKNINNPSSFDFGLLLRTIIGSEENEINQRQIITNYNNDKINIFRQELLGVGEFFAFQIAVWGDYSKLDAPENYLNEVFSLKLRISSTQAGN